MQSESPLLDDSAKAVDEILNGEVLGEQPLFYFGIICWANIKGEVVLHTRTNVGNEEHLKNAFRADIQNSGKGEV